MAILAGCASQRAPGSAEIEPLGIEWRSSDWRFCEQSKCQRPTPKSIAQVPVLAMQPVVQNESQKKEEAAGKNLPRNVVVLFPFNSAEPTDEGRDAIEQAARVVRNGEFITIEGYTDSIGGKPVNDDLATKRAERVAKELKRLGVKTPIEIQSEGKCCYVAANDTKEGRSANRRVEIHISSTLNTKAKE